MCPLGDLNLIFVTVGSWGFDNFVKAIDSSAASIDDKIVIQIANGKYEPVSCEFFRTAPSLDRYYNQADLVVAHGGTGTTLEVLSKGIPLISVANPDVKDNHQHEFLEALESVNALTYCRELESLGGAIAFRTQEQRERFTSARFFVGFAHDIDQLKHAKKSSFSTAFRRMAKCLPMLGGSRLALNHIQSS